MSGMPSAGRRSGATAWSAESTAAESGGSLMRGELGNDPGAETNGHHLRPITGAKFAPHSRQVTLHRESGQAQLFAYFPIGVAIGDVLDYFDFPIGQFRDSGRCVWPGWFGRARLGIRLHHKTADLCGHR